MNELTLSQKLDFRERMDMELSDPDREILNAAEDLWFEKEHHTMNISINELLEILRDKKSRPKDAITMSNGLLQGEFVYVSREEIKALDENERFGVSIGNCIFIFEEVDPKYVPLLVLNLSLKGILNSNASVLNYLEAEGIDFETAEHWTSNLVDILAASKYLSKEDFSKYLQWRKKIERTDFFRNELIDQILTERLASRKYRETTHPLSRHPRAKHSWQFSSMLSSVNSQAFDKFYRDFGITKADIIIRKLVQEPSFNPEHMLRLISRVNKSIEHRKINEKLVIAISDESIDCQAYLLTRDVIGHQEILRQFGNESTYSPVLSAARSLSALSDRIVYFMNSCFKKVEGFTPEIIQFLKTPLNKLRSSENRDIELDLSTPESRVKSSESFSQMQSELKSKRQRIVDSLHKLKEFQRLFDELITNGEKIIPGQIEEQIFTLETYLKDIESSLNKVEHFDAILKDFSQFQGEYKELISHLRISQ